MKAPGGAIVLATVGSWGDVRPFVHLARSLRRRGHRVRLLGPPEIAPVAVAAGLESTVLHRPFDTAEHRHLTARLLAASGLEQARLLVDEVALRDPARQLAASRAALAGARLLVAHHLAIVPTVIAGETGVPTVEVSLCPGLFPSDRPPVGLAAAAGIPVAELWQRAVRELRTAVAPVLDAKLGPDRSGWWWGACLRPALRLLAASPTLCRLGEVTFDGPTVVTGAWEPPSRGRLPADLERWIEAGPPPVLVTFGSMGAGRGRELAAICREAAARAGSRLVLQSGWAGLEVEASGDLLVIGPMPHAPLFARAAAVVHHAGAGTAHAAARSGRPSVPVPFLLDQPYWARCLREWDAAAEALPLPHLDAVALAGRLETAIREPALAAGAARLAAATAGEDGLAAATAAVEGHLAGG